MRKIISIILLSLMMLQAIPVLHFFAAKKAIFYAYIDEEKPEKGSAQEKDECKAFLDDANAYAEEQVRKTSFSIIQVNIYATPHLDFLTPPPDAC
jgi:hypothetical protein